MTLKFKKKQEVIKVLPTTTNVPACPKCHSSKNIIHNAMQGTYYCALHPRAIAEEAMK